MTLSDKMTKLASVVRRKALSSDKLSIDDMTALIDSKLVAEVNETSNLISSPYTFDKGWFAIKRKETSNKGTFDYIVIAPSDGFVYQSVNITKAEQPYVYSFYARAEVEGDKIHTETFHSHGFNDFTLTKKWQRFFVSDRTWNAPTNVYFGPVKGNKGNINIALPVFNEVGG